MIRVANLYLIIFIALLLCACHKADKNIFIINSKVADDADDYKLKIDSVSIPLKEGFDTLYYTYTTYAQQNQDFLIGYNAKKACLDIINLTKAKCVKHLFLNKTALFTQKLDRQDLDKSKSITDITVIGNDSILINDSNNRLLLVDTNLNLIKAFDLNAIAKNNNLPGRVISYSSNFRMLEHDNKLLLNQIYPQYSWEKKVSVFSALDMKNEKLTELPLSFSDYLYEITGKGGYLVNVGTSEYQKNGLLTYNYMYESNIYQFKDKDSTLTIYGGTMSGGSNYVTPIEYKGGDDLKKWDIHNVENTQFFNVMYDKFRNVYYRFSLKNIDYKNGKYFNSILDKPLVLMIFNEKFEVIKEITLPLYIYAPNTWFINKQGLYISSANKKNKFYAPDKIKFHIYKITR
ncbi:DUF4221 domain-containing protein [Mucilaginibacter roseus]|uniref:DUF4221 domain-containing protein n=1 Tax=Mucilaginibacter roseus TaxID=1528868 RepID=A0ABS8U213_9SPHI|nr:DUF4221 family protein [Mucilaginibacter roseus]MCD8739809.1 DUF4221 domain-containing protein [Mucilaginibacter roseus]